MMTAGVVIGKVITAEGQLQLFQSRVEQTKRAWSALPSLFISSALIHSVIKKFEKEGVRHIDPIQAREVADGLRHISERISRIHAKADLAQATRHLPWRMFMPTLRAQGRVLRKIAQDVYDYERQWLQTIQDTAAHNITAARNMAFSGNLDVDWDEAERYDTPENELASHNSRMAVSCATPQQ